MVSRKTGIRGYPRAVTAGPEHGDRAFTDAIAWAESMQAALGGQVLIYLPDVAALDDAPLLRVYLRTSGVTRGTWKVMGDWDGGPVLAAWPSRATLGQISEDPRTRALVVIPVAAQEISGWLASANPELLGPAQAQGVSADLDPVVVQGLVRLTETVNLAMNLTGGYRQYAVAVLRTLHEAGYATPAGTVYDWALSHGWAARGAERLRELAGSIETGKRLQVKGRWPLRPDALAGWREEAATNTEGG